MDDWSRVWKRQDWKTRDQKVLGRSRWTYGGQHKVCRIIVHERASPEEGSLNDQREQVTDLVYVSQSL